MYKKGHVSIVGAGPGDPDLITLKAKRALEKADVVLYDYLSHPNLLYYCKRQAILDCVGKRKGHHHATQDMINQKLVHLAQKGHYVVRLKGGDPMLFGRGAEEMAYLAKHHISYDLIPAISSLIAVPSYAGIALTHRSLSRSVAFVTGTLKKGQPTKELNIPTADTLVFVMAVSNLDSIVEAILCHLPQMNPTTPAALIYNGTRANEQCVTGTLDTIVKLKNKHHIQPPALFIVGYSIPLAKDLAWTQHLLLHGKRIILLRQPKQAQDMQDAFADLGAEVCLCPLLDVKALNSGLSQIRPHNLHELDILIFTSAHGVCLFMEALQKHGGDSRSLAGIDIATVGPKTSQCLAQYGIKADVEAKQYQQEGLLKALDNNLTGKHILCAMAQEADPYLEQSLKKRGAKVRSCAIYQHIYIAPPTDIKICTGDSVIFTSASMVHAFFRSRLYQNQVMHAFSIGPKTSDALKSYYKGAYVQAKKATTEAIIDAVLEYFGHKEDAQ